MGRAEIVAPSVRAARLAVLKVLRRVWVPLLVVAVVVLGVFMVDRLRGRLRQDRAHQARRRPGQRPRAVQPEGSEVRDLRAAGSDATINYLDLDAQPQKAENVTLPWSLTLTTTAPAASPNIVAQGDGDSISCRITVDGVVKDEKTTDGLNAQTFCLVKSA